MSMLSKLVERASLALKGASPEASETAKASENAIGEVFETLRQQGGKATGVVGADSGAAKASTSVAEKAALKSTLPELEIVGIKNGTESAAGKASAAGVDDAVKNSTSVKPIRKFEQNGFAPVPSPKTGADLNPFTPMKPSDWATNPMRGGMF